MLGYDLLNEPWPGTSWQDCINPTGCPANDAKLEAFDRRVLIRDPRRRIRAGWCGYEPFVLFNQGGGTSVKALDDPNAAFSFHDYCLAAEQRRFRPGVLRQSDDLVFRARADQRGRDAGRRCC